jgi:hypothetical protein
MREMALGLSILLCGVLITWALFRTPDRSRYAVAPAGDVVVVLDTYTGQLQTFAKAADSGRFVFVGADSRKAALEREPGPK